MYNYCSCKTLRKSSMRYTAVWHAFANYTMKMNSCASYIHACRPTLQRRVKGSMLIPDSPCAFWKSSIVLVVRSFVM